MILNCIKFDASVSILKYYNYLIPETNENLKKNVLCVFYGIQNITYIKYLKVNKFFIISQLKIKKCIQDWDYSIKLQFGIYIIINKIYLVNRITFI